MSKKVEIVVGLVDKTKAGASSAVANIGNIGKKAALLGGAAVAGIGAVTAGIISMAASAEPLAGVQAAFEGVAAQFEGGSAAMLAALQEGSAGLIKNTDLMESYNKAAQLVGEEFANKLPDAMGSLGKVAQATGQDMGFLLDSLVTGVGRLSPMILDNLGIQVDLTAAYEDYAKVLGKSTDELTKTEQQTAVMNQVLEKLADNTANMPEIDAPFARLKTAVGNAKDSVMIFLFDALSPLANVIADFVSGKLPAIIDAFKTFFSSIQNGESFLDSLSDLLQKVGSVLGISEPKMKKFADAVGKFGKKAKEILGPVIAWVQQNVELQDVLIVLGAIIGGAVVAALASLVSAIGPIIAIFAALGLVVAGLVRAWETNFLGIRDVVAAVFGAMPGFVERVKAAFSGFGSSLTPLSGRIDDIKAAFSGLAQALAPIVAVVGIVIAAVAKLAVELGVQLLGRAAPIINGFIDLILGQVNAMTAIISGVVQAIVQIFQGDFAGAFATLQGAAQAATQGVAQALGGLLQIVDNILGAVFDAISNFAADLTGNTAITFEQFKQTLANVFEAAFEAIEPIVEFALDNIMLILQAFSALFSGDWELLATTVQQIVQTHIDALIAIFNALGPRVIAILQAVASAIKAAWNSVDWGAMGQAVIDGVVNALNEGAKRAIDAAAAAARAVLQAIKDAFSSESPSKEAIKLGMTVPEGLAIGIGKSGAAISAATQLGLDVLAPLAMAPMAAGSSITNAQSYGGDTYNFYAVERRAMLIQMHQAQGKRRQIMREFTSR